MPRGLDDPTAELTISSYFEVVELFKPRAFLLENVPGMVFKSHQESFDSIIERGKKLGYKLTWKVLNAADFGVPQIRKRFFLVGTTDKEFVFPKETHCENITKNKKSFTLLVLSELMCGSSVL